MMAVSWVNFAVNIVLAYGLKYLWNVINLLQMAVFFPQWKLSFSDNAKSFLKFAKMIALMEFLPFHLITDPMSDLFGLESDCDSEEEICDDSSDTSASSDSQA